MLTLKFEDNPKLVKVLWDDITNLAAWHSREEIESHWEQSPFRCENIGYHIASDGNGAMYIASRKGSFDNAQEDAWGLIERIPKGVIYKLIYLTEPNVETAEILNRRSEIILSLMDDCLIAIEDGRTPSFDKLLKLPPWRAVMIARVAVKAGVLAEYLSDKIHAEASRVGGEGELTKNLLD